MNQINKITKRSLQGLIKALKTVWVTEYLGLNRSTNKATPKKGFKTVSEARMINIKSYSSEKSKTFLE